ncbi:hypothetical protein KVV02_006568 [Mortierella alpina]|uniref:F-box domain-containing protein n=1 Tax=Mortierella alpina TaxID=64518 RepID=A0A9P8CYA5_MORAP|nr:hypothetical protein KVV02_006568 [Mortierella alpina]
MRKSAVHAVLSTPELILLVSSHLPPYDLAQCNLVCKDWSRQFEPIIWTDLSRRPHHDETLSDASLKAALIRNLPHIRALWSFSADETLLQVLTQGSATEPSTFCANLKRLEFEDVGYERLDRISLYLATLLDLNHRLTHLELPFEWSNINLDVKTGKSEGLSTTSTMQCEGNRAISSLLQACLPLPSLTQLLIELDLIWDDGDQCVPDLKTTVKEAAIVRFSRNPRATKITSLRLPSNRSGCWNPLPLLLFKSSLLDLQSCEISWFDESTNL